MRCLPENRLQDLPYENAHTKHKVGKSSQVYKIKHYLEFQE